jgi:hypothetical protein
LEYIIGTQSREELFAVVLEAVAHQLPFHHLHRG